MRVLFVGNYDIAGKYIAERLFKEGHRVFWHTEEPEKHLWNESLKGGIYRYDLNYKNCSQIIKAESPDCLIFLTQDYRAVYDWSEGRMINMGDYETEVLRAASALGVKKIVYLSSTEVANTELLNPAMEKLRAGERLCQSVCAENKMDCLIVRSGIIYGEGSYLNQGFVDGIIRRMLRNKKIYTQYAYGAEFDFIFGSDYADAMERLLAMEETGLHVVTTGYPVTLQEIYDLAVELTDYRIPVEYGVKEHRENQEECLKFKRLTGWMPFKMVEENMRATMQHYVDLYKTSEESSTKKKEKKDHTFLKELLQNLAAFVLFMLFDMFSSDWSDLRFVDVKLLYVIVIAISFGMRQGIIAILLAVAMYFAKLWYADVDMAYIAYSIDTWIPFIMYGIAGTIVGYISDKKNDDLDNSEEEFQNLKEKYSFLKSMYQEVLNIKNYLQKQIMISKDSLGHIYEITEELDDTRPRTVMIRTVKVVEETMDCSSVAIYTRNHFSSFGRLMACSGDIAKDMTGSINFSEYKEMEDVLVSNEIYVNTALTPGYPSFAMPVFDGENMVAVVAIYNMDPGKYTVYYKNLFKTLILIMKNCLVRAYNYQENNRGRIFFENTNILRSEEFKAELESINHASEELQYPFSLGRVMYDTTMSFTEVAEKVAKSVRATDIVGCDEEGNIFIILLFVATSNRGYTEQRFEKAGLQVHWEN